MSSKQGASVTPIATAEIQAGCSHHSQSPPSDHPAEWSASASLKPPPLPYLPGACFDIKPHNPPPPLGPGYHKPDPKEWIENPWPFGKGSPDTIIDQHLAHPPRKTTPPTYQSPRCLQVTHQIRCGDPCMAQVVRCRVDGTDLVAKIFDPLYVGIDEGYGFPPTYYSERFYSCEAAAYKRIKERGLDGRYTPGFMGCWFLELPLPAGKGRVVRREIRLILQEFVPGDNMRAIMERGEADKIDPQVRMELLDRLMEGLSQLDFIGVLHDDLHPRNLMVSKGAKNGYEITLIDFSHPRVQDLPNSKFRTRRKKKLPESPITITGSCWPPNCSDWIPKEYDGRTEVSFEKRLDSMKKRWEKSDQYEPVNYE
ncbi:hypothetical protein Daus18300_006653 [Diaporthe australafricana]|uniref:Protein kinase domain-containing protein n=1 Tax=Diaporthe australafricana TaxID=127596 RepID=A0ABR3WSQ3_9PEZI